MQQFHKSLVKYYSQGGRHLYNPDEMEKFCESAAPGLFDDIFTAIYNDDKQALYKQHLVTATKYTL